MFKTANEALAALTREQRAMLIVTETDFILWFAVKTRKVMVFNAVEREASFRVIQSLPLERRRELAKWAGVEV